MSKYLVKVNNNEKKSASKVHVVALLKNFSPTLS